MNKVVQLSPGELKVKLIEQIELLDKSLTAFFDGDKNEIFRVAVILRVLLHDTNQSTSLFRQLGLDKNFWVFNLAKEYNKSDITTRSLLLDIALNPQIHRWLPRTHIENQKTPRIPLQEWWKQPIIVNGVLDHGKNYTRKDIVCLLSNLEGGAHIGTNFPEHYYNMTRNNSTGWFFNVNGKTYDIGNDLFIYSCASIAFEFLTAFMVQFNFYRLKSVSISKDKPEPIANRITGLSITLVDKK